MNPYRETLYVRGADGSLDPFPIVVGAPRKLSEREFACRVSCPLLRTPARIRSSDPEHAYALAFRFVKDITRDFALLDRNGRAVEWTCPPWPPAKGRRVGGGRPIAANERRAHERFRKTCLARRADGARVRFRIDVGAPRRLSDGRHECRMYCSALKKPLHVRAATPAEARFLAFRALREIMVVSGLRFAERAGNAGEIPCPPRLPYFADDRRSPEPALAPPQTRGSTPKPFRKTFRARDADGRPFRFEVRVGTPTKISDLEYECRVSCPLLRTPARVRFVNPEGAYALAFRTVGDLLRYAGVRLIGRAGTVTESPRARSRSPSRPRARRQR
jgi:hypothetical protein